MEVADKAVSSITIKVLPQMRVAAYRVISTKPEKDSSNFLKKIIEANGLDFNSLDKYGVDVPIPTKSLFRGHRGYESLVRIPDEIEELQGAKIKTILKSRYAVLRVKVSVKYPLESISNGWLDLQNWILMNGFRPELNNPNRYMLEKHYLIDNGYYLDLYFPFKEAYK